ncbi:MAG: fluoride efflux transporter CrcB [Chloroflexi bacterium]|nr:fluoride efflux transporter CrcB [Chloroflexota bacterium]
MQLLLIAIGGAAGALMRYGIGLAAQAGGVSFPTGTLAVNLTGAFALGFIATFLVERTTVSPELRIALTIGVLGAYTTFSTFSLETLNLLSDGEWSLALLNIIASVTGSVLLAWAGQSLARA